jgi:hypothetical protein
MTNSRNTPQSAGKTAHRVGPEKNISLLIEIVGLKDSSCSPFPCDETRSCGLTQCHPTGNLINATRALTDELKEIHGDSVTVKLILIDNEMPGHVRDIIDRECPPIPFILVDRKLVPMGRISLPQLEKEIEKYFCA